ncbi:MAG TPA: YifB family Mg chelatase-like AAA ATPase [Oscillospiraceae bacterium]|nr:YifB family Mg chelatase-like AAA ATPase [Oscillospiraceae bacterium]HPS35188.1 YifB family Mg chelatase-like AAA ATPase [Oscillospiraceae bacterium]
MFSVFSFGTFGMDSYVVRVEADYARGMFSFDVVGLPDAAVQESKERVRAAIRNSGFEMPIGHYVVNLSPADVRKAGPVYDLPILMAILADSGQIEFDAKQNAFIGELSLDGELRPVRGIVGMLIAAREAGYQNVFIPEGNRDEGGAIEGITVYPAKSVNQIYAHLKGGPQIESAVFLDENTSESAFLDFSEVKGQYEAKRALEIAVAGAHNVLMIGPPGSGKSMLAKRIPTIMPPMTLDESLETTKIFSLAGQLHGGASLIKTRPFRAPHHTISTAGLSGGGKIPGPGEISLAHNGVLFLDEFPEFSRQAMEVLRQPIEDGTVMISRASGSVRFPCNMMLVAAMNPCPCGFFGHPSKKCICSVSAVEKYLAKLSGPMLDRIDIHIEVPQVEYEQLSSKSGEEKSAEIAKRVLKAREIQRERFGGAVRSNADMTPALLEQYCALEPKADELMHRAFDRLGLSARGHDRLLKVARTIADLDESEAIKPDHIAEAVQYRGLERKYWHRQRL